MSLTESTEWVSSFFKRSHSDPVVHMKVKRKINLPPGNPPNDPFPPTPGIPPPMDGKEKPEVELPPNPGNPPPIAPKGEVLELPPAPGNEAPI